MKGFTFIFDETWNIQEILPLPETDVTQGKVLEILEVVLEALRGYGDAQN